jgi:hypothetical protein
MPIVMLYSKRRGNGRGCFIAGDRSGHAPGSVQVLVDEQDYDDRAQNDYPIRKFISRYRCFLLEPFHCLPPTLAASFGDNSKCGQDTLIASTAKLLTKDEAQRVAANVPKLPEPLK